MASLTWLGHAAFRLESDAGAQIYVDPWLKGNPKTPDEERSPVRVDVIAITHGHSDHVGDAIVLSQAFPSAQVICQVEVKGWLGANGAPVTEQLPGLNKGGSQQIDGVRFTLVNAFHSSSAEDGTYLGEACGIVVALESGASVYFAGDTCVFGDMALIHRLYHPTVAALPIGDHFTMGPQEAAVALELLGNPQCVPCHFGTFPLLSGTVDELVAAAPGAHVHRLEPGETIEIDAGSV